MQSFFLFLICTFSNMEVWKRPHVSALMVKFKNVIDVLRKSVLWLVALVKLLNPNNPQLPQQTCRNVTTGFCGERKNIFSRSYVNSKQDILMWALLDFLRCCFCVQSFVMLQWWVFFSFSICWVSTNIHTTVHKQKMTARTHTCTQTPNSDISSHNLKYLVLAL